MKRSKLQLLNFEFAISLRLLKKARRRIGQALISFEEAVDAYNKLYTDGVYHKTDKDTLLLIVKSMVHNCPDESHPIFVNLKEERLPYSRKWLAKNITNN